MLRAIVEFSLRFRGIVIALACLTVLYGLYATEHARLGVFPEFAPPQVTIQTEAPGLSPEQVETLVTQRIENVDLVGPLFLVVHPVTSPGDHILAFNYARHVTSASTRHRRAFGFVACAIRR